MSEFLSQLLTAVLCAIIPLLATYAVKFINSVSANVEASAANIALKTISNEVFDAITTAVTYVSQTYVDVLKKNGEFTSAAQKAALEMALNKTMSLLSVTTIKTLEAVYGNVEEYLTTKIEAEVRNQNG